MHSFKVVSDLICPWCYIGKRRLEAALRALPRSTKVAVSWHPFQLNPEMPLWGMDRNEYCMRKFGDRDHCLALDEQLTEVGRTVGLELRLDLQDNTPNTLDSHRVILLAGTHGVQDAVVEALFKAYFCEGVNLSERHELISVAASAGLDSRRVERMLESTQGLEEVKSEEQSVKMLGVSSVPLFIIDDCVAVSGAQPPETLVKAFEQALELKPKKTRAKTAKNRSYTPANS